jgi:pimeloyl-ACP methyl ester carboxylesterase
MRRLINDGYHVVNYDARGHGESDWSTEGDYSLDALASDLRVVLAHISSPIALVGASMGGITGFYAIGSSDEPMTCPLVMVDVALRVSSEAVQKILGFMVANPDGFATLEEAAGAVVTYNPERPRASNPQGLLKNLRKRDDGRYHWHWDPRMVEAKPSAGPPDFTATLIAVSDKVKGPVLLIRGGRSDVVTAESTADMQRLVPQTETYEVPGAGHMVAGDQNDAFNQGVLDFLRRHHPLR